jgi:hypothetical protein
MSVAAWHGLHRVPRLDKECEFVYLSRKLRLRYDIAPRVSHTYTPGLIGRITSSRYWRIAACGGLFTAGGREQAAQSAFQGVPPTLHLNSLAERQVTEALGFRSS